jgi:hypothetical protein
LLENWSGLLLLHDVTLGYVINVIVMLCETKTDCCLEYVVQVCNWCRGHSIFLNFEVIHPCSTVDSIPSIHSHTSPYICRLGNTFRLVRSHHQTFCFKNQLGKSSRLQVRRGNVLKIIGKITQNITNKNIEQGEYPKICIRKCLKKLSKRVGSQ